MKYFDAGEEHRRRGGLPPITRARPNLPGIIGPGIDPSEPERYIMAPSPMPAMPIPTWFDTLRSMRESTVFSAEDVDKAKRDVIGYVLMERNWNVDDLPFTLSMVTASDEPGDPWRILNAIERETGRVMTPDEVLVVLEGKSNA